MMASRSDGSKKLILVLMKGHPGTGKSALARNLAARLGWPLIDKDDARDALEDLSLLAPQVDLNQLSYSIMFNYVRTQLQVGLPVIMDCPLARANLYDTAEEIARKTGAAVVLVECEPSDEAAWAQRLAARAAAAAASAHKPNTWADLQALIKGYDGCWRWNVERAESLALQLKVDTTARTLEENAVYVETHLRNLAK